ncbi:hypothetical protein JOC34_003158 [Virgibacillus halotolerans]|uniref:hypothetical protein n=1 Tax=Virgibacillus halotolerans TaxID=1071053 RepID=UPI001961FAB4|nr:hypothetical protein [Virgibacillus halotolerans]MBM7600747.1 hypothetical protein [Virgibacillus halotolerans]
MKYFLSVLIFLSSLYFYADYTAASEKDSHSEATLIETYQADVTGNGQNEEIKLKGTRFSNDTNYYQDIWIEITDDHNKHWKVNYGGGYEPTLKFIDLNNDQVSDILYQSANDKNNNLNNYQLHTLNNGQLNEVSLPEQLYIDGKFMDDYHVQVKISPDSKPIDMNVKDRAETYIHQGIYDEQGKLLKSTPILIDPIAAFDPFIISESKGYGLKSYKQINGGYQNDQLGTVETTWYFEDNDWIILQSEWVPADE